MKKLLFILVILNLTSSVTIFGAIAKPAPKTVVKSNSVAVPKAAIKSNGVAVPKAAVKSKSGSCFWSKCSSDSDCCPGFPECGMFGLCH